MLVKRYFYHFLAILLSCTYRTPLFIPKFLRILSISAFVRFIFSTFPSATVLQIGAHDGQANDPLYRHLKSHTGRIVLVEALPYYCELLTRLWRNYSNIMVVNSLITDDSEKTMREFFYIDPIVADQMDGNGPPNRWAHGQGSLYKNVIIESIEANSFRGEQYVMKIPEYISSIRCTCLQANNLPALMAFANLKDINLLVIDVQGAELLILSQLLSLQSLPEIILTETDSSAPYDARQAIADLLGELGYFLVISGASDSAYCLPSLIKGSFFACKH